MKTAWNGEWKAELLEGDVAIVTGGGRGIGWATARQLGWLGAKVVLLERDESSLEPAVSALEAEGITAVGVAGDVRDEDAHARAVATGAETFGSAPTILVSNAGITRDSTIRKMGAEQWREVLDIHLTGAYLGIKAVLPGMAEASRGAVVVMSSTSSRGAFGQANYSSAKAGLIGLARTASMELARHGVRVNAVAPGVVDTEMVQAVPADIRDSWIDNIPLRRFAEPAEIARTVAFLCSPLASYITGEVVFADGGMTVGG